VRPYLKNTQLKKRAGRVAQVVEHLSSKHKALRSNPSTDKKKKMVIWLSMVICTCNTSYMEGEDGRITVQVQLQAEVRPYQKSKKD
jgi:Ni,Fe-hydrogenase I small subunit